MRKDAKYEQIQKGLNSSFRYGWSTQYYQDEIPLHFHPEIEITYILKGGGYRMTGDYLEPFDSGELILVPSNIPHCWIYNPESCIPDGNRECIYIQFPSSFLEEGMAFFPEWKHIVHKLMSIRQVIKIEGGTCEQIKSMIKQMVSLDANEKLLTLIRIIQLVGTTCSLCPICLQSNVCNDITNNMNRIQTILKYIVENYKSKILLSDVAAILNMTDTGFCAFFKRETKQNFISFVNEYRLDSACSMLRDYPEMDIKEVAWECGFTDTPYFNRYFKKIKRMTPRQWRSKI